MTGFGVLNRQRDGEIGKVCSFRLNVMQMGFVRD